MAWSNIKTLREQLRTKTPSNRGRRFLPKTNPKATYPCIKWENKTKKTKFHIDTIRIIINALRIDATKNEACALAFIHPNTFDNWYASNLKILWEFDDILTDTKQLREATFKELVDRYMMQSYLLARKALYSAIEQWSEKAAMRYLQRRDPRYNSKALTEEKPNFIVNFWGPPSPFVKKTL